MKNYWSCSKFADWLRGTPKPYASTLEGWNSWENDAKTKTFRYWLAEDGLDYMQNFFYWPFNQIKKIHYYINNSWVTKSHALTSNLKRGQWYDFDTRLLHAIFDELTNFVEIELAWMFVVFSEDDQKKYKPTWYLRIFSINNWRSAEAGVAYLNWAKQLKFDENIVNRDNPNFGKPTYQALAAEETHALYQWWKEVRPKRLAPGDLSGWNSYCNKKHSFLKVDDDERSNSIWKLYKKIEEQYEEEDTAMLIRLIKIRQQLWT